MSTDLHQRLADLADEASVTASPGDLWSRGRREAWQRRGVVAAASLLVAASVVAAIGASSSWLRGTSAPGPASTTERLVLPDALHQPPRWMPGTDDVGLPGRISALVQGNRGDWWTGSPGVAAVSAHTAEMVWLDLPDDFELDGHFDDAPAISPGGHRVAFWTLGEPRVSAPDGADETVVGVAVWDAETGDVVRHPLPSDHGLWAGLLTWADNDFLVIDYSVIRGGAGDDEMDQSSAASAPTLIWPVGDGEPHVLELEGAERSAEVTSTSGGWLIVTDHRSRRSRLGVFDVRGRQARPWRVLEDDSWAEHVLDAGGGRVAAIVGHKNPAKVSVANLAEDDGSGPVSFRTVPGSGRTFRVLTWLDDERVAVVRRAETLPDERLASGVFVQDVVTERSLLLVRLIPDRLVTGYHFAPDLLDSPVVTAPAPDARLDPRVPVAGGLLAMGALAALLIRRRRRVQP